MEDEKCIKKTIEEIIEKPKKNLKTADIKAYRQQYYEKNKQAIIDKVKSAYHEKADVRKRVKQLETLKNFDNTFNEIQEILKDKEQRLTLLKNKLENKYKQQQKVENNEPFFVAIVKDLTTDKFVVEIKNSVYEQYGKPEIKII